MEKTTKEESILNELLLKYGIRPEDFEVFSTKQKYILLRDLTLRLKLDQDYEEYKYNNQVEKDSSAFVLKIEELNCDEINARIFTEREKNNLVVERKKRIKTKIKKLFKVK